MIELGLKVTLAYLVGSVLGSLLVGFFYGGVDIRKTGSGNAGGTNALRTQGKVFALWVMVIDIGKGILVAIVIPPLVIPGVGIDASVDRSLVLYGVAVAAIVGHVFPVWFGFRGGKGAATAAGLVCYLAPAAGLRCSLVARGRVRDRLRRTRDDQRGARRGDRHRLHGFARGERLVPVRLRYCGARHLRPPRQHPPNARRHRVEVL
jgi:acyl-phosphate glycerol 3-phosphate acyltransferase